MFRRSILGGSPDAFKILLGHQVPACVVAGCSKVSRAQQLQARHAPCPVARGEQPECAHVAACACYPAALHGLQDKPESRCRWQPQESTCYQHHLQCQV